MWMGQKCAISVEVIGLCVRLSIVREPLSIQPEGWENWGILIEVPFPWVPRLRGPQNLNPSLSGLQASSHSV
jgi:hypothetical protein